MKGGRTGTAEDRGARSDGAESGGLGERTRASGDGDCGRARADGRAESVSLSLWLVCPKQTRSWSRVALGRTTNEAMRGGQRTGAGRGGERRRELLVGGEAEGLAGGKHGWRLGCWCWTGTELRRVRGSCSAASEPKLSRRRRTALAPSTSHCCLLATLALLGTFTTRHPTHRHRHEQPSRTLPRLRPVSSLAASAANSTAPEAACHAPYTSATRCVSLRPPLSAHGCTLVEREGHE